MDLWTTLRVAHKSTATTTAMTGSSKEREKAAERAVRLRRKWIEAWHELGDAGAVCRRFGISRPTLRKWLGRYEAAGEAGLRDESRRPKRSPGTKVGPRQEEIILGLRRERRLGIKRLRVELIRLHDLHLSSATLHNVLVRHNLGSLPRRKRGRHTPKRYSRPVPGDRVQMDSCKLCPGVYQFAAVDDCSRYLVVGVAKRPSATATLAFLAQVLEEVPFAIQRVQTDSGAEFFAEAVQRRLMAESIKFRPIPPRSPHLNGKVERAHRTVLEEFGATVDPKAPDVGARLAEWVHHYNWHRPHEAINGLCPIDRVCERVDQTPLWEDISVAYEAKQESLQAYNYTIEIALRSLKRCP